MADTDPTSWPPATPEVSEKAVKPRANTIAGWISLVLAILIAILHAYQYVSLKSFLANPSAPYSVVGLGTGWIADAGWIVSLVLGIVGWKSWQGKTGIAISLVSFVVLVLVLEPLLRSLVRG